MTAAEVADLMAERNPRFARPSPEHIEQMQRQVDEAAARLTATKARELARLWLPAH